jgi:hypothetical protein
LYHVAPGDPHIVFGVLAGAASLGGLVMGYMTGRQLKGPQADIHVATQSTLADLGRGFRETQERLAQMVTGISEGQQRLGAILERMDQRADERHRELVQVIEALRR